MDKITPGHIANLQSSECLDILPDSMVIMGIDPARCTGYCVMRVYKDMPPVLLAIGEFLDKAGIHLTDRIKQITNSLIQATSLWDNVGCIALESGFVGVNLRASLALAEIRGVVKTIATIQRIEVFEFAPTSIRKIVLGNGKAKKEEVKKHVCQSFPERGLEDKSLDICDAIAAALCLEKELEW